MKSLLKLVLVCGTVSGALQAEARVFAMKDEHFASYLAGSYGTSEVNQNMFLNESSAASFDKKQSVNESGEFGFVYLTGAIGWRFGFEAIIPPKLSGINATDANGSVLYNLSSALTVYAPKVGLEIHLKTHDTNDLMIFGYYGQASLTGTNTYTNVSISPNANFTQVVTATAPLAGGGLGYEFLMSDKTTLLIEAGYRALDFEKPKYSQSVTNFQGAQTAGSPFTDSNGLQRVLNFTGYYATVSFRFWLM